MVPGGGGGIIMCGADNRDARAQAQSCMIKKQSRATLDVLSVPSLAKYRVQVAPITSNWTICVGFFRLAFVYFFHN